MGDTLCFMALEVSLNGQTRVFEVLEPGCALDHLVEALGFKRDRVAIELNGEIVPRREWSKTTLNDADKLELVHFVGGG